MIERTTLAIAMGAKYTGWTLQCDPHFDDGYQVTVTAPDGRAERSRITAHQVAMHPGAAAGVELVLGEAAKLVRRIEQNDPQQLPRCTAPAPLELVRCW